MIEDVTFIGCNFDSIFYSHICFINCKFINCIIGENCTIESSIFTRCIFYKTLFNYGYFEFKNTKFFDVDLLECYGDVTGVLESTNVKLCPTNKEFIGWKKAVNKRGMPVLVKLLIPADAKTTNSCSAKCRCDKAKVLEIKSLPPDNVDYDIAYSMRRHLLDKKVASIEYKVGEWVYPDDFYDNICVSCAPGIHFFMNKQYAIDYMFT